MVDEKDRGELLASLRIDRVVPKRSKSGLLGRLIAILVAGAVVIIGAGIWFFWPDTRIPVRIFMVLDQGGGSRNAGLDASGYVVAHRKATLSAKILGKLVEVNFQEGQRVAKDEVVARLDDSNYSAALEQAVAQEAQAKAAYEDAAPIYNRYAQLIKEGAISMDAFENERSAYDAARTAYDVAKAGVAFAMSNENDTIVRAPFDGVVTDLVAQVGEIVAPAAAGGGDTRTGIVTIVDMRSLEIEVDVSENYIDRVQVGGQVGVHLDAYPDWEIAGKVIAVIPTADKSKGTVKVRIAIKTEDSRVLPQMAARVTFLTNAQEVGRLGLPSRITVPPQAVRVNGQRGSVYLVSPDNTVEKREVTLGLGTRQSVVIISGISPGDRLVMGDLGRVYNGAKVTIRE